MILTTSFANKVRKAFLIQRTSLMFEDKLIFEAWVYDFFLLVILVKLLMFDLETSQGGNVVFEVN